MELEDSLPHSQMNATCPYGNFIIIRVVPCHQVRWVPTYYEEVGTSILCQEHEGTSFI